MLTPTNVVMSHYGNASFLNGGAVTANRGNAFAILTNEIVDRGAFDTLNTFNSDNLGLTLDFVGLTYATPSRFDFIQLEIGRQFSGGGNWESKPFVYILKDQTFLDDTVEPNMVPHWIPLPTESVIETTGHTFIPLAQAGNPESPGQPGGTIRFDLTGIPVADRTGWAWAVGGVDGRHNASGIQNFVSLTEVWAEGASNQPTPTQPPPSAMVPVNVIANVYNSVGRSNGIVGDGLSGPNRGQAFASVTNGFLDRETTLAQDGFDTCCGPQTDFVGLLYSSTNRFDTITVELGNQFFDGGDWDYMPRIFILKNPMDTNQTRPETDPTNWREVTGAVETTGHVFSYDTIGPNVAGGTLIFDLSAIPEYERTGYGWAVGGVDGNAEPGGVRQHFVSVTELDATGTLVTGPGKMKLEVYAHGEVRIVNQTELDLPFDAYQVTSAGNVLNLSDWNSLGDGAVNSGTHSASEFPVGTGMGDGWEEMFNLTSSIVAEAFVEGSSLLEAGQFVSLGGLFGGTTEDLAFRYRLANGEFVDGDVEYVGLPGDYNDDGFVNAADFALWRDKLNGHANLPNDQTPGAVTQADYAVWTNNFGTAALSGSGSAAAVPEPSSIVLGLGMGFAMALASRFRGKQTILAAFVLLTTFAARPAHSQSLTTDPLVQANFSHISEIATGVGGVTQMAFGPDGKLYVATYGTGVKRFDYDPSGNLSNGMTVWTTPGGGGYVNGSLGLAFHQDPTLGTVMYVAPALTFGTNPQINITQSIVRLTDDNGDGNWGQPGELNQAIVNNLRMTDLHQVNQMQVRGNELYVGIGSRTRTGGEASEYPGTPNPDDGEFAYTGAINWIRDLTQLSSDTTTANLAGYNIVQHHTDTQAYTSTDTGKLTVYSTGFRNVYGLAFDGDGQLWATMNQNENPLKPDELHRSDFQDDHSFPQMNEVSGDWKTNPTAQAAGFYQNFKTPVALLGNNASADGIAFTDHTPVLEDYPFLVRWGNGDDLLMVNPETGFVHQVVADFANPLSLLPDPNGHLLIGTHGGGGRIYRLWLVNPDLDDNDDVDYLDWLRVRNNFNLSHDGMTVPQARALGDLNGDFKTDLVDYDLFKKAYEGIHGTGSFAALLAVPEPHSLALTILACVGLYSFLQSRSARKRQPD